MKKFVVLIVVAALTLISTSAFATHEEETNQPGIVKSEPGVTAGVAMTFSGSIDIRERFYNLGSGFSSSSNGGNGGGILTGVPLQNGVNRKTDTQERVRFNVDAKVGDYLNGRISIENNWDTFGRNEAPQGNGATAQDWDGSNTNNGRLDIREAWMNFMIPGLPVGIKGGHQLLQLGNGWFFRAMKYGSDAWVGYWGSGNNTLAFYDVRVGENVNPFPGGVSTQPDQDIDFYGVLDAYKLADGVVSVDLTWAAAPSGGVGAGFKLPDKTNVYNLGLSYAAKTGPVHLKAEVDLQSGKADSIALAPGATTMDFKGYQGILQATLPIDPLSINFTFGYGSGNKAGDPDFKQIFTVMDNDQHYTLIYEYLEPTGALNGTNLGNANESLHTGFANTMAVNIGGMFNISKILAVGVDYWYLKAVEDVAIGGNATASNKLGNEVDFKLNWKLYDNLTWNWQAAWFKHGDAYKHIDGSDADDSTAVLGMLTFKF
jgi:hypothetical protein